jgi:hypothetical protein
MGESSLTISRKPDSVSDGSQRWIAKGERSGLLTRIAHGKGFVVSADENLTAFVNSQTKCPFWVV